MGLVTVNYNSAAFVEEFLDSLALVEYPAATLVVVDAGSTDDSVDLITARCPDAHVIRCDENVGIARGNNLGLAWCRAQGYPFVLFVNNDTTHERDFLRILVDTALDPATDPTSDTALVPAESRTMVVPRILFSGDHRLISTHAGDFDWDLGLFRHTHHGQPDGPATRTRRELQTASFCCMLVPTRAFDEAGDLDEAFFMYYEETDWLRGAIAHGYRLLYEPDAVVYHQESASSGGGWMTPFKLYYATRNRLYLVHKHARSRVRYAAFTAYFWTTRAAYVLRYLVTGKWRMLRALALGVRDYYRGRMGRTLEVHDL